MTQRVDVVDWNSKWSKTHCLMCLESALLMRLKVVPTNDKNATAVRRILLRWFSYRVLVPLSTESAEGCLNTWRRCVSHQWSSPSFFHPLRIIWFWKRQVCTALPVSVEKFTLDKLNVWFRHHRHICLYHSEKSAVKEQSIDLGHWIQPQNAIILAKKTRQWNCIRREARDWAPSQQINRVNGFNLSRAWKPLICDLK
jgi:hypothetical protein